MIRSEQAVIDQLEAATAIDQIRATLTAYDSGEITVGEAIGEIAGPASAATQATLHAGWDWLDDRVAS